MSEKSLAELAAEKRREYKKAWYAKNRERCKEHTRRYWQKKALQEQGGNSDVAKLSASTN